MSVDQLCRSTSDESLDELCTQRRRHTSEGWTGRRTLASQTDWTVTAWISRGEALSGH